MAPKRKPKDFTVRPRRLDFYAETRFSPQKGAMLHRDKRTILPKAPCFINA